MLNTGQIHQWLHSLGLSYHPFEHLEASADPNLFRHLVLYDGLAPAWQDVNALVWARAGGGKSTLRLYAAYVNLKGLFDYFPISYVIPRVWASLPPAGLERHLLPLARAAVDALLFLFAVAPQRLLDLNAETQSWWAGFLGRVRPDMPWIALRWQESGWGEIVADLVEPGLRSGFEPPPEKYLREVGQRLVASSVASTDLADVELFGTMLRALVRDFGFRRVHLLVDGLDAHAEMLRQQPAVALAWFWPWLGELLPAMGEMLRVKAFLPDEARDANMIDRLKARDVRSAELVWTEDRLAEMIRRRVYAASAGAIGSLDAISSSELRDLDITLVRATPLLPREVLVLVQRLLYEHVQRAGPTGLIDPNDVAATVTWYETEARMNLEHPAAIAF